MTETIKIIEAKIQEVHPSGKKGKGKVSAERKVQGCEILNTILLKEYPRCFNLDNRKPLKIGIRDYILKNHPNMNVDHLKTAMHYYCGHIDYLSNLKLGASRIDLEGQESGDITPKDVAYGKGIIQGRTDKLERLKAHKAHRKEITDQKAAKAKEAKKEKKQKAKENYSKTPKEVKPIADNTPKLTPKNPVIVAKKPVIAVTKKRPTLSFLRDK